MPPRYYFLAGVLTSSIAQATPPAEYADSTAPVEPQRGDALWSLSCHRPKATPLGATPPGTTPRVDYALEPAAEEPPDRYALRVPTCP